MADVKPTNHQSAPRSQSDEHVIVGRIKGPWGLAGDVKVERHTSSITRFDAGNVLYVDGRRVVVQRSRAVKGDVLVKLDIASSRDDAESLRGLNFTLPQHQVDPLPEGSYYYFQIIDVAVWDEQGEYLGSIKDILPAGGTDVYIVQDGNRRELLIAALADVILDVDLSRNRMTVRLPEGIVQG